jgi:hypothetical protein
VATALDAVGVAAGWAAGFAGLQAEKAIVVAVPVTSRAGIDRRISVCSFALL